MSSSLVLAICVVAAAIGLAAVIGFSINRRSGVLRETPEPVADTADLGLSTTGPTVLHFSAVWCGPCAAVGRVVNQVCNDLPGVAHVEIDMDANLALAQRLSVLSLPTTFIFDAEGRQLHRTAGVPKASDLRAALVPLLAPGHHH